MTTAFPVSEPAAEVGTAAESLMNNNKVEISGGNNETKGTGSTRVVVTLMLSVLASNVTAVKLFWLAIFSCVSAALHPGNNVGRGVTIPCSP